MLDVGKKCRVQRMCCLEQMEKCEVKPVKGIEDSNFSNDFYFENYRDYGLSPEGWICTTLCYKKTNKLEERLSNEIVEELWGKKIGWQVLVLVMMAFLMLCFFFIPLFVSLDRFLELSDIDFASSSPLGISESVFFLLFILCIYLAYKKVGLKTDNITPSIKLLAVSLPLLLLSLACCLDNGNAKSLSCSLCFIFSLALFGYILVKTTDPTWNGAAVYVYWLMVCAVGVDLFGIVVYSFGSFDSLFQVILKLFQVIFIFAFFGTSLIVVPFFEDSANEQDLARANRYLNKEDKKKRKRKRHIVRNLQNKNCCLVLCRILYNSLLIGGAVILIDLVILKGIMGDYRPPILAYARHSHEMQLRMEKMNREWKEKTSESRRMFQLLLGLQGWLERRSMNARVMLFVLLSAGQRCVVLYCNMDRKRHCPTRALTLVEHALAKERAELEVMLWGKEG